NVNDLLFHPPGGLEVRQVELASHVPLAVVVHRQPIGMFFGDPSEVANAFRVHPQTPQHARSLYTVPKRFEALRKALAILLPVTHGSPPAALRSSIPTGIDEEDLSADLRGGVDCMVNLLRRDLNFGTDSGLEPPA